MKISEFQECAVGAVGIYDGTFTLVYFGSVDGIPSELLDCCIHFVQLGMHASYVSLYFFLGFHKFLC